MKIGFRIIKSAAAVFLCFVIYMIRGAGIPFYSAIAAILCMQRELDDAKAKGKSRLTATLIGGVAGMVMLYLLRCFMIDENSFIRYTVISIALIPLIALTVMIKQPDCSYLTCVVYLCVCVSHGSDADPFAFALNRMIDTWIGIIVALGVNAFHLPHHYHKEVYIEVPLSYLLDQGSLTTYTQYHLKRYLREGLHLLLTSSQTPASLNQCVRAALPHVSYALLDGSMYYDQNSDTCTALCELSYPVWSDLEKCLLQHNLSCFLYSIKDGRLYLHHEEAMNEADNTYYLTLLANHQNHFILYEQPLYQSYHHDCVMLELLLTEEQLSTVYQILADFIDKVTWVTYPQEETIFVLRIYAVALAQSDACHLFLPDPSSFQVERLRYSQAVSSKQVIHDIEHLFYHGT